LGIFILAPRPFRRSPAPSISLPVNPGVLVLPSHQRHQFNTPPSRTVSVPQTAPTIALPRQPITPSNTSNPVTTFMARSEECQARFQQEMTRSKFIRYFGHKSYEKYKWRWNGAPRNARR